MSYLPNPALGGVGGMFEYQNAVSMGIDQVSTYHPLWTSGVVTIVDMNLRVLRYAMP